MQINQPRLFVGKLATLLGTTIVLVPLIHYKLIIPTLLYIGALLLIHIWIFYVYVARINWRELRSNRIGFILRLLGIVLFSYILTLLHYQGATTIVLLSIAAAVAIHALILLLLMARSLRRRAGSSTNR
ncbi:hypothetical protein HJC99_05360 [Candidatus Saccharibacteria bacterium]|nr:hypothetical protein [Candidatus Saccharibacteria bacterium]